jgi:hypothetical protein
MLEIIERVDLSRCFERLVFDGRFCHLIEEQLVGRFEVCSEPLVEGIDELRQDNGLVLVSARTDFSRPLERFRFTRRQFDRALADLLQSLEF